MIFPILNILSNCKLISYFTGIPNIPIFKQSESSDEKCGYVRSVSVEVVTVLAWSALPVLACCSPRRETWQTFCIMRCYFATSWFYLWCCRYCWGEIRRRGGYWNVEIRPDTLQIGLLELSTEVFTSCRRFIFMAVPCYSFIFISITTTYVGLVNSYASENKSEWGGGVLTWCLLIWTRNWSWVIQLELLLDSWHWCDNLVTIRQIVLRLYRDSHPLPHCGKHHIQSFKENKLSITFIEHLM